MPVCDERQTRDRCGLDDRKKNGGIVGSSEKAGKAEIGIGRSCCIPSCR